MLTPNQPCRALPCLLAGIAISLVFHCADREQSFDPQRLVLTEQSPRSAARAAVRAYYSGHSLSDGLPELVSGISASRQTNFQYAEHSLPGSTIRERNQSPWPPNFNRAAPYDFLVVTERHDLLYTLLHEQTLGALSALQRRLLPRSPHLQLVLYQGWLEIDFSQPEAFVQYEQQALIGWECAASALNRTAVNPPEHSQPTRNQAWVLPGGWALANFIEHILKGGVPALGQTPNQGVASLFRDTVHLSAVGQYYLGSLHYGFLYGASPEGAPASPDVSQELAASIQQFAWQQVRQYQPIAEASAQRSAALCRDYIADVLLPRFIAHPRDGHGPGLLRRWKQTFDWGSSFRDKNAADNPFGALTPAAVGFQRQ